MQALPNALIIILLTVLSPCHVDAAMLALGDDELSAVIGRAGVSIDMDLSVSLIMDRFMLSDTSAVPNWLEFRGFSISNSDGGSFPIKTHTSTLFNDGSTLNPSGTFTITPTTLDLGTDPVTGRTSFTIRDSSWIYPRTLGINQLVFAGQELGSLTIDQMVEGASVLRLTAPHVGEGLEFDYTFRTDVSSFRYRYNSSNTFALNGIHFVGSATGAPENPSSWTLNGNYHIGETSNDSPNPAYLKVGTLPDHVTPSTFLALPMQGTIRIEDVSFGSNSFGPIAIDGINVHRFQMRLTP